MTEDERRRLPLKIVTETHPALMEVHGCQWIDEPCPELLQAAKFAHPSGRMSRPIGRGGISKVLGGIAMLAVAAALIMAPFNLGITAVIIAFVGGLIFGRGIMEKVK